MIDALMLSFGAAFGWGISPILARMALEHYDNITFIILRALIIGTICLIFMICRKKSIARQIHKNGLITLPFLYILLASVVVFVGSICYYTAMHRSSDETIIISLISYILPLIVITLASYCYFDDKINIKMGIGMALTIIGVCMVVYYNPNKSK